MQLLMHRLDSYALIINNIILKARTLEISISVGRDIKFFDLKIKLQ
jgi:hypothetical protein